MGNQGEPPASPPAGEAQSRRSERAGHVLELYKNYVSTAEAVSDRRQKANAFFLTLNTAIVALVSYLQPSAGGSAEWAADWYRWRGPSSAVSGTGCCAPTAN
jgi:hypothetical protein